jgi:LAO/AO transport system ATPase
MARLAPLGVVVAPVQTMEKALASDLVRERDMVVSIPVEGAALRAVGNPIRIAGDATAYGPPPRLGEHNAALLREGSSVAARVLARERRAIARAISEIERGSAEGEALSRQLARHCGRARMIGITGPPGAGKSTLVAALAKELLALGRSVAVVAVDPSSPLTGGALLGDRIRMGEVQGHDEVFIRSLASRGHAGGVSGATGRVAALLDAAGFDVVLIETVGAGQSEVEIAKIAATRLVVCPPGLGDDVQALKAGILEIADAFVVNKADLPGADRAARELHAMLALGKGVRRPVFSTVATTGRGVEELARWLLAREAVPDAPVDAPAVAA